MVSEVSDSEETLDSDDIDDEFITQYCEMVDNVRPMTVSRELFYTDSMVARNYERLSEEDKKHFDQMKELAESAKQETGEYSLIEDLMARVVGERFSTMKAQDVEAVMGKPGEGAEGGKHVKREGSRLVIKSELGTEAEKVVISAIVPAEESTLIPYCIKDVTSSWHITSKGRGIEGCIKAPHNILVLFGTTTSSKRCIPTKAILKTCQSMN